MSRYSRLFESVTINGLTSRNRLVFEPMGNYYAELDGTASQRDADFYAARARGGCGLVITEICSVNGTTGRGDPRNLCIDNDGAIPSFAHMVDAVHDAGSAFVLEIFHPGCQGTAAINGGTMASPSGQESKLVHEPTHEMSVDEIESTIEDFVSAGVRCYKAGFDGVELHGAHGYLLCEFLSPYTNHRDDAFGGTSRRRAEIVRRIIVGIRERTSSDFAILVRLSADEYLREIGIDDGITLPLAVEYSTMFEEWGADAMDISAGNYETMNWAWEPVGFDEGWKSVNGETIADAISIPVIACSVVRHPKTALDLVDHGVAMVGSARQFYADPEWGNKVQAGHEESIRPCISCMRCIESLMAAHEDPYAPMVCSVNPEAGRECDLAPIARDGVGRTAVIVGAGPSGLEAARVLSLRGFATIVLERDSRIGGQLLLADKPPKKWRLTWLVDYYASELARLGVDIRTSTTATVDGIKALNPDVLLWAAGSTPIIPSSISGLDGPLVLTPPQVISGDVELRGESVCVVGSGMTGIETAELLASQGNHVKLYEMLDQIGPGIFFQNLIDIMGRIAATDTELHPSHRLVKVEGSVATFENEASSESETCEFDHLVLSLGTRPVGVPRDIEAAFPSIVAIGDASSVGRIQEATRTGYDAARAVYA